MWEDASESHDEHGRVQRHGQASKPRWQTNTPVQLALVVLAAPSSSGIISTQNNSDSTSTDLIIILTELPYPGVPHC